MEGEGKAKSRRLASRREEGGEKRCTWAGKSAGRRELKIPSEPRGQGLGVPSRLFLRCGASRRRGRSASCLLLVPAMESDPWPGNEYWVHGSVRVAGVLRRIRSRLQYTRELEGCAVQCGRADINPASPVVCRCMAVGGTWCGRPRQRVGGSRGGRSSEDSEAKREIIQRLSPHLGYIISPERLVRRSWPGGGIQPRCELGELFERVKAGSTMHDAESNHTQRPPSRRIGVCVHPDSSIPGAQRGSTLQSCPPPRQRRVGMLERSPPMTATPGVMQMEGSLAVRYPVDVDLSLLTSPLSPTPCHLPSGAAQHFPSSGSLQYAAAP